ncbi:TPA: hypothetical protein SG818_001670 [Campylobacter coli]|nr:hypothetical protein [Campylobacter coli]
MNCFKKLKEKIILIKIEKEKASEEKFLKECEIKEAEIRMEILEKRKYLESKISKENNVQTNINELKNDNKAQKKSGGMMFNFGNNKC